MPMINDLLLGGESVSVGLVAHAGGGQAAALPLTSTVNVLATVATAADSVMLPQAVLGTVGVIVDNTAGANSCQVYGQPATSDTINGIATATGFAVASGKRALFYCYQTSIGGGVGKWGSILTA